MSLLRLLKLGSSMARVRDGGSYQLATKNLLPTFGGGGKPAEAQPPVSLSPVTAPKVANPIAGAAQSELSLDKVQVVRNDLAEADIEVVQRLPKAPPGSTIPAKRYVRPQVQPDQLGKKAWGLLGARLFGQAAAKH